MALYPLQRDKLQKPKQIKDRETLLSEVYERLKERQISIAEVMIHLSNLVLGSTKSGKVH